MMLPQGITSTTPNGGSLFQQQLVRPSQAGSFAGSHRVTADTQGTAGAMGVVRDLVQGMNTGMHQRATAALNYQDGAPDNEVRNQLHQQKLAANQLVASYKDAMFANLPESVLPHSNLRLLGASLGRG